MAFKVTTEEHNSKKNCCNGNSFKVTSKEDKKIVLLDHSVPLSKDPLTD